MAKSPAAAATLILALTCSLAACGGNEDPRYDYAPLDTSSVASAPPASVEPTEDAGLADGWFRITDASGVSFEMPDEVDPEENTSAGAEGTTVTRRMYQSQDASGISMAVVEGMDLSTFDPAASLSAMTAQLELEGATDVTASGPTDTTFGAFEGVETAVSFTASDGLPSRLFMVTITVGDLLVLLQANDFEAAGDEVEETVHRVSHSVQFG